MKYTMSGGILRKGDALGFAESMGVSGDAVLEGIGNWLRHAHDAEPNKAPLCMACDYVFLRHKLTAEAFFVLVVADRKKQKIVNLIFSPICPTCGKKEDRELLAYWHKQHADKFLGPIGPDRTDLGIIDANATSAKVH